jgi:hypothetical protein
MLYHSTDDMAMTNILKSSRKGVKLEQGTSAKASAPCFG